MDFFVCLQSSSIAHYENPRVVWGLEVVLFSKVTNTIDKIDEYL